MTVAPAGFYDFYGRDPFLQESVMVSNSVILSPAS